MIASDDRIGALFAHARAAGRAALIPYLMAGDPDLATTAAVIDAISPSVDLIELGIPYGDPLADGPTIAAAGQRALGAGTGIDAVLNLAADAAARGSAPILFFTYVNPVVQYGPERFAAAARAAGALGAIVPRRPARRTRVVRAGVPCRRPRDPAAGRTDDAARREPRGSPKRATDSSTSFRGWGSRARAGIRTSPGSARRSRRCARRPRSPSRSASGSRRPAHVAAIGKIADGIIVGSALIDAIAGRSGADAAAAARRYVGSLRAAM